MQALGGRKVMDALTIEAIAEAEDFIKNRWPHRPQIVIVCGSGLGQLADLVQEPVRIPYSEIPHFACSTVPGHVGQLVAGQMQGKRVCLMQGRLHPYEGHSYQQCTFPLRVLAKLGTKLVILTNAAGSLREDFRTGDIVSIIDHLNLPALAGFSPLWAISAKTFGDTFVTMNNAYDKTLRLLVYEIAQKNKIQLHKGIYATTGGPQFETPAECRMLRQLGADVVGMSTAHEAIVARHCGMKVMGFSMISNMCILDSESDLDQSGMHTAVMKAGESATQRLSILVNATVAEFQL